MKAPIQSRVDVKEAVRAAKAFVADVLAPETVTNIGLEEVRFDEDQWMVTVGFSRPWDYPKKNPTAYDAILTLPEPEAVPERKYKVVKVDAITGEFREMALRDEHG